MMAVNNAVHAEEYGPFDAVFELADVSGPMIGGHHIDSGCANSLDVFFHFFGIFFGEEIS